MPHWNIFFVKAENPKKKKYWCCPSSAVLFIEEQ
jgi:hypothetical protein